ncbi:MAG: hypothetical protein ACXWNR_09325, partial [Candidatus Limnocylindrales bacterium]
MPEISFPADEAQERGPADARLLDRQDDARALVTARSRRDLLCRSDEHLVAAGDGLPLRGTQNATGCLLHASLNRALPKGVRKLRAFQTATPHVRRRLHSRDLRRS